MKTFVIPDLHGRYDLLRDALATIQGLAIEGTVVFLGDYVDRGPQSKQIIDRLIQGPPPGWKWVCLRGNHEDMLLECHDTDDDHLRHWWARNGGETTLQSYGGQIDPSHIEWFKSCLTVYADAHRVYVHAGVGEHYELADQPEQMTQWYKYPKGADVGYHGRHVVHGHDASNGPAFYTNRTNLDARAYASGRLCIGAFDDQQPGGHITILWVGVNSRG